MDIDFTALTLAQAGVALVVITALDVGAAYALAVIHGNFSLGVVAVWVQSHVIRRVFPIIALFALGHGISVGDSVFLPAIPALWAAGLVALAAYALETIKSITASFADTTPPADTTPTS